MKRLLSIGIIILFIGMSLSSSTGFNVEQSNTATSNGKTLYVGGSEPGNYTRIQDAIDNASDGDTVYVFDDSSPYYEKLIVEKSITLIGEDKDTTIVDGKNNGTVIQINVDRVNVTGFTIKRSSKKSGNSYAGIKIKSSFNKIYNNIICNHYTVGIAVWYSPNNEVFSNDIYSTNVCISLFETKNNKIYENTIKSGDTAIAVSYSSNNKIHNNTIESAVENGIFIYYSNKNKINYNIISKCYIGINTVNDDFTVISLNIIKDNDYGIWLGFSDKYLVYANNLQSNLIHGSHSVSIGGIWIRNYWGRPRFLPKIILGDLLWLGRTLKFDFLPAKRPYNIEV